MNAACTPPTTSRVGQAPGRTQTTQKERQAGRSWERAVEGNVTRREGTGARTRGGAASLSPTDRPPAPRRAPARPTAGRAFCAAAPRVRLRRWVTTMVVIFERVRLARRCAVAPSFGSFVRSKVRSFPRLAVGRGRGVFQVLRQLRVGLVPAGAPLLRRRVRPARGARVRLPFAPMRRPDVPTTLVPRSGRARGDQPGGAVAP